MRVKVRSFERVVQFTRQVGVLRRTKLFQDLPQETLHDLARRVSLRRHPAGEWILSASDEKQELHIVFEGVAKAVITGSGGREITLAQMEEGDTFGEVSILGGGSRPAGVMAHTDTATLVLDREAFLQHLSAYPQTAMRLLESLAQTVKRSDQMIGSLALNDVGNRLTETLLTLAQEKGESTEDGIAIYRRPTQQDLANQVGTCRETVSRVLSAMVRQGLVISRGRTLVLKPALYQSDAPMA